MGDWLCKLVICKLMAELIVSMHGYDMGKVSENSCRKWLCSLFWIVWLSLILGISCSVGFDDNLRNDNRNEVEIGCWYWIWMVENWSDKWLEIMVMMIG